MSMSDDNAAATVTREFYDRVAEEYVANTKNMGDTVWLDRFAAQLPDGARVLDVGCAGTGYCVVC